MVPVTSSCQLSVAVDAQSTDLCRAGATSRYGERCAQLPWCAHPSSDVWRPLAQPLSTISTHTRLAEEMEQEDAEAEQALMRLYNEAYLQRMGRPQEFGA